MSENPSVMLYGKWQQASEKFDYFVAGILMALLAYLGQGVSVGLHVGGNATSLSSYFAIGTLVLILLAAIAALKRIESVNLGLALNVQLLHAGEVRGSLKSHMGTGPRINVLTGDVEDDASATKRLMEIERSQAMLEPQYKKSKLWSQRHYDARNYLLLAGLCCHVVARAI